jgi:hypothetical protein
MPEIEITIDKEGNIDIDLVGYHGQGCSQDSEAFARALGTIVQRDKKHEYWQQEHTQEQHLRHGQ